MSASRVRLDAPTQTWVARPRACERRGELPIHYPLHHPCRAASKTCHPHSILPPLQYSSPKPTLTAHSTLTVPNLNNRPEAQSPPGRGAFKKSIEKSPEFATLHSRHVNICMRVVNNWVSRRAGLLRMVRYPKGPTLEPTSGGPFFLRAHHHRPLEYRL